MCTKGYMGMTLLAEQQVPVHANGRVKPQRWHISECCPKQLAVLPVQAVHVSDDKL